MTSFIYLGKVLSAADDNFPAVVRNMEKSGAVLRWMLRTISREGVEPRVSEFFFKDVVQSVIIFSKET